MAVLGKIFSLKYGDETSISLGALGDDNPLLVKEMDVLEMDDVVRTV